MGTIKKGLKLKGRPAEIPDCSRNDLPGFFKEMGFKVGAEIGVYKGDFTKNILDAGLKTYGIDPWKAYGNYNEFPGAMNKFQKRQDFLFEHTKRYLKKHIDSGLCELVRKTSMEAVEDFEDESLDFVYIDGHHGFRYVAEDLVEWTNKVRKGGVVSGHDYALNRKGARDPYVLQVKYVLHAYVDAFGINNWYVLGRKNPPGERIMAERGGQLYHDTYVFEGKEEKRDRWRSWFFIKE